jgi:hypothetical protein
MQEEAGGFPAAPEAPAGGAANGADAMRRGGYRLLVAP